MQNNNCEPIDLVSYRERRILRARQADGYVALRPLLEELGIGIEERVLSHGVDGEAFYAPGRSPSGFVIVVNKRSPIERRRFTAAHELGHCLIHGEVVKEKSISDFLNIMERAEEPVFDPILRVHVYDPFIEEVVVQREREADQFAASLLMPKAKIRAYKRMGIWRFKDLAQRFGVSKSAMKRRLIELGYYGSREMNHIS